MITPGLSHPVATPASLCRQVDCDEQVIAMWLRGKSVHSVRAYQNDVSEFQHVVGKPLAAITLADLQRFAGSVAKLAPATQNRALAAIKSLLTFCHKAGYLPFNVGAAVTQRRPENSLSERILNREAILKMLALEVKPRDHALLQFLYETGCRVSELCSLNWSDVQPRAQGTAEATLCGKEGRPRTVLFSAELYEALTAVRGGAGADAPVFPSRSGRHLDQPAVFRLIRNAAIRAGVPKNVSPTWLRHACASHALDAGVPIHLVKAQLGHASLETTAIYLHARPDDGAAVAQARPGRVEHNAQAEDTGGRFRGRAIVARHPIDHFLNQGSADERGAYIHGHQQKPDAGVRLSAGKGRRGGEKESGQEQPQRQEK